MIPSNLITEWQLQLRKEQTELPLRIVENFVHANDNDIGDQGVREEINHVVRLLEETYWTKDERRTVARLRETGYLIWALKEKLNREDILRAVVTNWGDGSDDGTGSSFRSFEYECHTALRFLEEGFSVEPKEGKGKPEMVIEDAFFIECKRPSNLEGVFKGALKGRKQIQDSSRAGFIMLNIDDLNDYSINLDDEEIADEQIRNLLKIAEHGMGDVNDQVLGLTVEQVAPDPIKAAEGSFLDGVRGCNLRQVVEKKKCYEAVSFALTGDDKLSFRSPSVLDRYSGEWSDDKGPIDAYFNEVACKEAS